MLPVPSLADLALFTGRAEGSFSAFAPQALLQATLLFSVTTGLEVLPDDSDLVLLADYAIMEMADRFLGEQPYLAVRNSPFQSETIGSYSYSRTTLSKTVLAGLKSGLYWWDLAVEMLEQAGQSVTAHGSIRVSTDGLELDGDGRLAVVNAAERDALRPPYVRIS